LHLNLNHTQHIFSKTSLAFPSAFDIPNTTNLTNLHIHTSIRQRIPQTAVNHPAVIMQLINSIAVGIAFIFATTSALPRELKFQNKQFSGNPFQVTDLIIDSVEDGDVTIAFTVYDPDPLANITTSCAAHWPYGSDGYPQAIYKSCGNTSVAWHMQEYEPVEDFENGIDFTIELKDTFKDPT
jgi:hypothetical protein